MIEFVITQEKDKELRYFEAKMLAKYKKVVDVYLPLFNENGCSLKVELGWLNSIRKKWSKNRLPPKNGYECHVYCLVERDGKEIRINSDDGEADYYTLETSWMISSIRRRFHKLNISLYASIDDVNTDLNGFLSQL